MYIYIYIYIHTQGTCKWTPNNVFSPVQASVIQGSWNVKTFCHSGTQVPGSPGLRLLGLGSLGSWADNGQS